MRFVSTSYRPSNLRATMESAGVKFASEIERNVSSSPVAYFEVLITSSLLLSLTSNKKDPLLHDVMFEWRHILYDLRQDNEYGELRRFGLERLKRKYRQEDPFEPYLPFAKPVTEALRNLVIEHTLPGNESSPWLDAWHRCVEYNPATALTVPFKDLSDRKAVKAFARSADLSSKGNCRMIIVPANPGRI